MSRNIKKPTVEDKIKRAHELFQILNEKLSDKEWMVGLDLDDKYEFDEYAKTCLTDLLVELERFNSLV